MAGSKQTPDEKQLLGDYIPGLKVDFPPFL
jgi:hypothetical protein